MIALGGKRKFKKMDLQGPTTSRKILKPPDPIRSILRPLAVCLCDFVSVGRLLVFVSDLWSKQPEVIGSLLYSPWKEEWIRTSVHWVTLPAVWKTDLAQGMALSLTTELWHYKASWFPIHYPVAWGHLFDTWDLRRRTNSRGTRTSLFQSTSVLVCPCVRLCLLNMLSSLHGSSNWGIRLPHFKTLGVVGEMVEPVKSWCVSMRTWVQHQNIRIRSWVQQCSLATPDLEIGVPRPGAIPSGYKFSVSPCLKKVRCRAIEKRHTVLTFYLHIYSVHTHTSTNNFYEDLCVEVKHGSHLKWHDILITISELHRSNYDLVTWVQEAGNNSPQCRNGYINFYSHRANESHKSRHF